MNHGAKTSGTKGLIMEEALRAYFLRSGYYVARSVALRYQGVDVTDVDIWLYERPSSVSRHRIIVDAKNRKTPQAIERIFWTKGLQVTLGIEQCIVATTDRRPAVIEFGKEHGVLVLDGGFVSRLMTSMANDARARLTEEEFRKLLDAFELAKGANAWRQRLEHAKGRLLEGLGYNEVNFWIEEARYFAEQAITLQTHGETAMRVAYLLASFVGLGVDFVLKDLAFVESREKLATIAEGLRHGTGGRALTNKIMAVATGMVERYVPSGRSHADRMRRELEKELSALGTDVLAEFFSRTATANSMFSVARELEAAAFARAFPRPDQLSADALSLLGALADHWGLDRIKFLGAIAKRPLSEAPEERASHALDPKLLI